MSVTAAVAERVVAARFADLPAEAVERAKEVCLDGFGVMLAGFTEPSGLGRVITEYVRSQGGLPEATLIGSGHRTTAVQAAFANGTMHHALDFDNTWYPLTHPTSPTLPALLAMGERQEASGEELLTALVLAFEVQGRLRLAAPEVPLRAGFHPPGLFGLMGATAAAARLLRLNVEHTCMAFGIAGSRAGAVIGNIGSRTKSSHAGHAARMGVESAQLAALGWTGHPDIFVGGGLLASFAGSYGQPDYSRIREGFGQPYRIVSPGVGFKKHPCHYFTHRPIDAVQALQQQEPIDPARVEAVEVLFPEFPTVSRPEPRTGLDGKFSVQYTVAAALLDGQVTVDTFTDERRFAPDMQAMLGRVRLVMTPEIPSDFDQTYAVVTVHLQDGTRRRQRVDKPRGLWGVPLTREERLAKFRQCAHRVLTAERAEQLRAQVESLERVPSIGPVVALATQ